MLNRLMEFIAKAEDNNYRINGPSNLPKEFTVHSDLYYIRSLLNNKFDKKYTIEDVEDLIKDLPLKHDTRQNLGSHKD